MRELSDVLWPLVQLRAACDPLACTAGQQGPPRPQNPWAAARAEAEARAARAAGRGRGREMQLPGRYDYDE